MAKTTADPAATSDSPTPDTAAPPATAFWRYTGVERILGDLSLHVVDGDVLEAVEPPGHPDWWVADDGPATVTPGQPTGFRVWTPDELQRGALAEDPPTTPGWVDDPQPEHDVEAVDAVKVDDPPVQDGEPAKANEAGEAGEADTSTEVPQ